MLLLVAVLFLTPGGALLAGTFWFWLSLLLAFWLLWGLAPVEREIREAGSQPRILSEDEQPDVVRSVMRIDTAAELTDGTRVFRGRLQQPADLVYARLKAAASADVTPLVQQDEVAEAAIVLVPTRAQPHAAGPPVHPWLHWVLFAMTVVTTTWAGAAHQGVNLLQDPGRFPVGLPYSLGLMAILGIHELGHYFMAKRHGIRVTPPYFIPVPLALGTFGAFIQMRSPTENRRALFDVAVAGPLAGLAVAIPALLVGLRTSTVVAGDATPSSLMMGGASAGSSILLALLGKLSLGPSLEYGHVLHFSALAFAGWLGLIVTALNLLPIGQLDGGHIAYAMFGRRVGTVVSTMAMWSLLLLAIFVWPGLTMWAILVFFIAGTAVPPLNDVSPLDGGRQWLGFATFGVLALILMPLPHSVRTAAGLHCPYL